MRTVGFLIGGLLMFSGVFALIRYRTRREKIVGITYKQFVFCWISSHHQLWSCPAPGAVAEFESSAMKPWLRLTLVTVTIGGGFTGIAITLQSLLSAQGQPTINYALISGFLALFAFVTVSGVVFVHDPNRIRLLILALALQIPWVSSPLIAYKFAAGFQVCAALIGGQFAGGFRLGSDFQINLFQRLPWGLGINFFALSLLVLLVRTTRTPNKLGIH